MAENKKEYRYIFGPVTSRRLGISLGIDLIPYKTCSLDCIYCECGKTSDLTDTIKEHIPFDELKGELTSYLSDCVELDAVTFAGSGEPTLNSKIGDAIDLLKSEYPQYKVVLLTNSTLFHLPSVRERVVKADTIIASFDAASPDIFRKLNRPQKDLSVSKMKEGLLKLREEFKNQLIIEIFVVPGINDGMDELKKIKEFTDRLKPEKIQINSLDRPGTCDWTKSLSVERKDEIERFFGIEKETIQLKSTKNIKGQDLTLEILSTIKRRPCTIEDLKKMTGFSVEVEETLKKLVEEKRIELKSMPRGDFYYSADRGRQG
jgi:wyosine [tRNA(Phe)-imidazoG37] synthetase (radical SAM superfamily)